MDGSVTHSLIRHLATAVLLALPFLCSCQPLAEQPWISVRTEHFQISTSNTAEDAQATLLALEQARSFFRQTTSLISDSPRPLRIIAFRSNEEYAPFRLGSTSFAHYLHSGRGDYIVLQDIQPQHRLAAVHEYTHFVFRNAGLKLPVWLCEGIADFYSSLLVSGNTATVGGMLTGRLRDLSQSNLLPLQTLITVNGASLLYNDPGKVGLFYAQAWALVHMLAFHDSYRDGFAQFIGAVNAGARSDDALHLIYRKTADEVMADLKEYVPVMASTQSATRMVKEDCESPTVSSLSEVDTVLILADLLASHRATAAKARHELVALTGRVPGNRQAEELLSYLATQDPGASAAPH